MANIFNLVVGLEILALLAVSVLLKRCPLLLTLCPFYVYSSWNTISRNETFADTYSNEQTAKQFEKGKAYHGTSLESESVREKVTPCG